MKQIIEIETADEVLEFARNARRKGDETPYLPPEENTFVLDLRENKIELKSEGERFQISEGVTLPDLLLAMAFRCNLTLSVIMPWDGEGNEIQE
jgi:hypothetical protein